MFLAQVVQGISNHEQDILVTTLPLSTSFQCGSTAALTRMSEATNLQVLPSKSFDPSLDSIISNSSRFLSKSLFTTMLELKCMLGREKARRGPANYLSCVLQLAWQKRCRSSEDPRSGFQTRAQKKSETIEVKSLHGFFPCGNRFPTFIKKIIIK